MDDLVYEILKEFSEGKKINIQDIHDRVDNEIGMTKQTNANRAWDIILKERYLKTVIPEDPNPLALNIISEQGLEAFRKEKIKRDKISQDKEAEDKHIALSKVNMWYQTQNAKDVFDDYPIIKKKQSLTLVVSVISAIVALAALIVSIVKK